MVLRARLLQDLFLLTNLAFMIWQAMFGSLHQIFMTRSITGNYLKREWQKIRRVLRVLSKAMIPGLMQRSSKEVTIYAIRLIVPVTGFQQKCLKQWILHMGMWDSERWLHLKC